MENLKGFFQNKSCLIVFIVVIILFFVFILRVNSNESVTTNIDAPNSTQTQSSPTSESSLIDYNEGNNYGRLWIGAIAESRGSSNWKMHATYTFDISYKLNDLTKTVTDVQITNISAKTNLPNGDLKILPYAHVSYSENGGSIVQNAKHEDWNTYGYVYVTDYKNLPSLETSYKPNICDEDVICDYLDEVGTKGGNMSLRFKYVDLGNTMSSKPEYQSEKTMAGAGITPNDLSGTFSWTLTITLDDGTVETKDYFVDINASDLDLASSNTSMFIAY